MKFIPISDDAAVSIERIEKVERISQLQTRLYCGFDTYDITLPYDIVIDIIEKSEEKEDNSKILGEISQKVGSLPIFAG